MEALQLKELKDILPQGWKGTQAYQAEAVADDVKTNIVLVPFADAGQTGGIITTWLKKK